MEVEITGKFLSVDGALDLPGEGKENGWWGGWRK